PDGKTLASATLSEPIKLWDIATAKTTTTISIPGAYSETSGGWYQVCFLGNGHTLLFSDGKRNINLRDLESGTIRHVLRGHREQIWCLVATPVGSTLVSCAEDQTIRTWDLKSLH